MTLSLVLTLCAVVDLESGAFGGLVQPSSPTPGVGLNLASLFDPHARRSCGALPIFLRVSLKLAVSVKAAPEVAQSPARPWCTIGVLRGDPGVDSAMATDIEPPVDGQMVRRSQCSN
jgi:hypothetical protein